ncbi:rRNA maturation RNase YbeY [Patescibacteria group bacterium]
MDRKILIKSSWRFPVDRKRIKAHLEKQLASFGLNSALELSVAFVGQRKMRSLNQVYRQLDKVSEVLSFSQLEEKGTNDFINAPEETLFLGDIVVCYPEAQRLAAQHQILVDKQIDDLLTHGLTTLLKGED